MSQSFQVTRLENARNLTTVKIDVLENGGFEMSDWSTGAFADEVYGSDVDRIIKLAPEAVQKLSASLTIFPGPKAAESCANYLTEKYKGYNRALTMIRDLCDQHGVQYSEEFWP